MAVGGRLLPGGATVTVTICEVCTPLAPSTITSKASSPMNPSSGVYVHVPSARQSTVPWAGCTTPTIASSPPVGSTSLPSTSIVSGSPTMATRLSATTTGGGGCTAATTACGWRSWRSSLNNVASTYEVAEPAGSNTPVAPSGSAATGAPLPGTKTS